MNAKNTSKREKRSIYHSEECSGNFESAKSFSTHSLIIHSDTRPFKCPKCRQKFTSQALLKRHSHLHDGQAKPCPCPFCGKIYSQKQSLNQHMRIHTKQNLVQCETCNAEFTSTVALRTHFITHAKVSKFMCSTCGYSAVGPKALELHNLTHTCERPFKCNSCPRTFRTGQALKGHERFHSGMELQCPICSYSTPYATNLLRHKRKHNNERPFSCDVNGCSKSFLDSSHLKEHKISHRADNRCYCATCGSSFTNESNRRRHEKVFHGEAERWKCEQCPKYFRSQEGVKQHKRVHDETRNSCFICGETFGRSGKKLKAHIRLHTMEKPYECEYCRKDCVCESWFKRHVESQTCKIKSRLALTRQRILECKTRRAVVLLKRIKMSCDID